MAVAVTVTRTDVTQNAVIVEGTLTLSGNYGTGASHGDVLNLSTLSQIPSTSVPLGPVVIEEAPPAGTAPTGYLFGYAPGTTLANGQLTIMNNLTEYTQGSAYNAGLLAAVIIFRAYFPYGV